MTGDPLKIVSGTEINDEYNAIQTAVNTKADINSPTLTGAPSAPTAGAGTNTTQLATTKFVTTALVNYQSVVDAALEAIYPIGSVYTNATNSANPSTIIGFGTWVSFGAGRVPVGFDSSNTNFDSAEETGGSYDAVTVSHTHSITDPGHVHTNSFVLQNNNAPDGNGLEQRVNVGNTTSATTGISVDSFGVSGTDKNIQPYITVYMWKRTA